MSTPPFGRHSSFMLVGGSLRRFLINTRAFGAVGSFFHPLRWSARKGEKEKKARENNLEFPQHSLISHPSAAP